jgi:hypothetical protein
MKVWELVAFRRVNWRNIPISLKMPRAGILSVTAWLQQLCHGPQQVFLSRTCFSPVAGVRLGRPARLHAGVPRTCA